VYREGKANSTVKKIPARKAKYVYLRQILEVLDIGD
jgi:hypothetical protein